MVALEVLDRGRATTAPAASATPSRRDRLWLLWKIQSEYLLNASMSRVAGVREPPHGDAAHAVGALGILVLPGDVVARARREHVDLVALGQPLGDEPAVVLGSAEDLGAVALDDEAILSRGLTALARRGQARSAARLGASIRSFPKSASRRRWPARTPLAERLVVDERAEQLGRVLEVLRREATRRRRRASPARRPRRRRGPARPSPSPRRAARRSPRARSARRRRARSGRTSPARRPGRRR